MIYIKTIGIPIYDGYINIVLADDINEAIEHYGLGEKDCSCAFVMPDRKTKGIYWVVFGLKKLSHNTIAHEIVHLVNLIFLDRGIKPDLKNDEPQAYLTGWLTDKMYKFIGAKIDLKNIK